MRYCWPIRKCMILVWRILEWGHDQVLDYYEGDTRLSREDIEDCLLCGGDPYEYRGWKDGKA